MRSRGVLYVAEAVGEADWDVEPDAASARRRSRAAGRTRSYRARGPRWARVLVVVGTLLMIASGGTLVGFQLLVAGATGSVTQSNLLGDAGNQAARHVNITGAVNVLLI